jgi:FtsZ-interacting cell division protein YlmF
MGFMAGVWRMLGADDDEMQPAQAAPEQRIMEHPALRQPASAPTASSPPSITLATEAAADQASKTIFIVRPELDEDGEAAFSLKEYAAYLLTEQAVLLDVNLVAGDDELHAIRIVDYLSGVAEAIGGRVFEVTKNIFIFTPSSLELAGDPVTQIEVN